MFTGRRRIMLLPRSAEETLGSALAGTAGGGRHLPEAHPDHRLLLRVGKQVAAAAEANGVSYKWRFRVADTQLRNAFCLPGGIVVVTVPMLAWMRAQVAAGVLPDLETALACVLCHEIGHAVARHGAERMGSLALQLATRAMQDSSPLLPALESVLLTLPHSRLQEREADVIGFVLYTYLPYALDTYPKLYSVLHKQAPSDSEAVRRGRRRRMAAWRRRAEEEGAEGAQGEGEGSDSCDDDPEWGLEWFSTHPVPRNRAASMRALEGVMASAREELAPAQRRSVWWRTLVGPAPVPDKAWPATARLRAALGGTLQETGDAAKAEAEADWAEWAGHVEAVGEDANAEFGDGAEGRC